MRRRLLLASPLALPLALGGCSLFRRRKPAGPPPSAHAVIGPPYQAGGVWRYPRASYEYDETGLAIVAASHGPLATDGAAWDATALMGSHPTLQLPSVVRVTNLETGRQILLRLDDRGPAQPSRLLAITPRAALLLGGGTEPGVLRVRVQIEDAPSRQLTAQLGDLDAPPLAVVAAPSETVTTESLPPPGAPGLSPGIAARPVATAAPARSAVAPSRLPETVMQLPVRATALWIDAGGLGQSRYAEILRARLAGLGAIVAFDGRARPETAHRVRIGPLASASAADAMLDRVLRAGVVDARIVVI